MIATESGNPVMEQNGQGPRLASAIQQLSRNWRALEISRTSVFSLPTTYRRSCLPLRNPFSWLAMKWPAASIPMEKDKLTWWVHSWGTQC